MRYAAFGIALVLLAGCAGPSGERPATDVPRPTDMFGTACPPDAWAPRDGTCVGTLGDASWSMSEPDVAIDPFDPDRFAIGVIAQAPDAPRQDPGLPVVGNLLEEASRPTCRSWGVCVFWTEDSGRTWTSSNPPAGDAIRGADPALAFGADGTLHFASLMNRGTTGGISYTSTTNGENWTAPVEIVFDAGQDRPWLAVQGDHVAIVWQDRARSLHGAFSTDAGATFQAADAWPACNVSSRPRPTEDGFLVGCADRETGAARVLHFSPDGFTATGAMTPTPGPVFLDLRDGAPVGAYIGRSGVPLLVDRDDPSAGWSETDLRTDLMDRWTWFWIGALAVDDDVAHVLVLGGSGERCFNAKCPEGSHREVVHIAVSLETGGRVGHSMLTPEPEGGPERARGGEQFQDDYDSIAFAAGRGIAAWGREGLVDWAFLGPKP